MKKILFILFITIILLAYLSTADRLPPQKPENQLISDVEHILAYGPMIKDVNLVSEQSSGYLHNGILFGSYDANGIAIPVDATGTLQNLGETVSQTTYEVEERTNGGFLEQLYAFEYDTDYQTDESWNLETDWIMTYASVDGSTLAAVERATLDVAGNYESTAGNMRCIFSQAANPISPAFCNLVTVESTLASVTSMTVQTPLKLRDTAVSGDTATVVTYGINVIPNTAQEGQYADGQVGVTFTTSIREANRWFGNLYYSPDVNDGIVENWNRNYWDDEARITNVVDTITATGGITNLTKTFAYASSVGL